MSIADELSIQLYSLRNHADLDQQLVALAGMGFKRVEGIGGHLADAKGTRAKLDANGITCPTIHCGVADLRSRLDWVAEGAQTIGVKDVYMPSVPPAERDSPADYWKRLGGELGEVSQKLAASGLRLGYHNHNWEMRPYADGSRPLEHFFAGAEGSKLVWEADIAWLARGDVDPVVWLERYKARLVAAHVKDIAPAGEKADEDGWADVGKGTLDWVKLWQEATSRGATYMVLEHDKPSDALRFARDSRAWLLSHIKA